MTADRNTLDRLSNEASRALAAMNIGEPGWQARHRAASAACVAAQDERRRLWKLDRWGTWMNAADKTLARITGEL